MEDIKYSVQFDNERIGLGFKPFQNSYVVVVVRDGSDAQRNDVRLGDVITHINETPIFPGGKPQDIVRQSTARPLTMHFVRGHTSSLYLLQEQFAALDEQNSFERKERHLETEVRQAQSEFTTAEKEKKEAWDAYYDGYGVVEKRLYDSANKDYKAAQTKLNEKKDKLALVQQSLSALETELEQLKRTKAQLDKDYETRIAEAAAEVDDEKLRPGLRF